LDIRLKALRHRLFESNGTNPDLSEGQPACQILANRIGCPNCNVARCMVMGLALVLEMVVAVMVVWGSHPVP